MWPKSLPLYFKSWITCLSHARPCKRMPRDGMNPSFSRKIFTPRTFYVTSIPGLSHPSDSVVSVPSDQNKHRNGFQNVLQKWTFYLVVHNAHPNTFLSITNWPGSQVRSNCKRKYKRKCRMQMQETEGGGGGYSTYPWVGRCGLATHILTLFKTKIDDFPSLF